MKIKLLILLSFCCYICYGQKHKTNELIYEHIQKPIVKLDRSWEYSIKVNQSNRDELLEKQKAFEETQKYYDEIFKKEMESYNNSKAAGKLLTGKPERKIAKAYFFGSITDTDLLENTISIEGFNKGEEEFVVEIVLEGFSIISNVKVLDEKKSKRFYKTTFVNPIMVNVKDKSNNTLWNKSYFSENGEHVFLERSSDEPSYEMEKEWKENKISLLKGLEDRIIKEHINTINEDINDNIGYPNKTLELTFFGAKGKKFDYSEIENSITKIKKAFLVLKSDNEMANKLFDESKEIWLKELSKKDIENKKVRINKKIATGLYINLGYVNMIQNEFKKAKEYSLEAELIRPGMGVLTGESMKLKKQIDFFEKRSTGNSDEVKY